ncbi:hypothetical protein LguiA_014486 [Lonicera macranthoides]
MSGDTWTRRASALKKEVREIIDKVGEPLTKLELIDALQRLGISYHFEVEIKNELERIYNDHYRSERWNREDELFAIALEFRLLRQHGYNIPQEIFNKFKDECGNFKSSLCLDAKGMLYLYEASFLSIRGETILDEARDFTAKILKDDMKYNVINNIDESLGLLEDHSLELPLHWRMLRLEARLFIDVYERRRDMNTTLLEFAKLDFNMVQATHQEDLKHMSRRMSTKVNSLVTTIDDIYDVYATFQELQLFTNAVERWDLSAMEQLPDYMKICFLALYNSTNEMVYDTLVEQGVYIISYLKKVWADLCKSYLLEAKWYYSGYTPTLEEYMDNAWISISAPVILVHAHFFLTNRLTADSLECLKKYPDIIRWSSVILRLTNDLGTSIDELKRGDNPKSIQCYMHETGASEDGAREHIKYLISETLKKINEEVHHQHQVLNSPFNKVFNGIAMNLARMAQCIYQHGDGHGIEDQETKDRVLALVIDPINLL